MATARRIVIIGGVAAGATAAARVRRLSERAEITLIERGPYVSYANCGLPYYISGDIQKRSRLLLQTPEGFDSRYRVHVRVNTEAIEIDRDGRRVRCRGPEGEDWTGYDALILAQGGRPVMPEVPGSSAPHVFTLWTVPDMDRVHAFLDDHPAASAVIAGGGFIGLEMAEALTRRKVAVTVVELMPRVMPAMDPEFGVMIGTALESGGVRVLTGRGLASVDAQAHTATLTDGTAIKADLVLMSVGVRPELTLARSAGLEVGTSGGLLVDEHLRTSDKSIYAAGDMVEVVQRVSGRKVRVPLAGPANRQGRIAASNAMGVPMKYAGALGSSVVKVFDAAAACTGLSESAARAAGFNVGAAVVIKDHHAAYFPGARELVLKLVYDRSTAKLLGAQAFGQEGVEKRIDVLAAAAQAGMTLHDLAELDLCYAPPFSSANDPVNMAAFVGENDISGYAPLVSAAEARALLYGPEASRPVLLDVRNIGEYGTSHVRGALNIPLDELRFRLDEVPRDRPIIVHCKTGFRSHLALRILKENGFPDVRNLTGSFMSVRWDGGYVLDEG
jgi:NADPH-dependent 2,4-dienoyl-CoA reductase/sulfur reductase-like enzyme/rhodanese-related sulfurtransferase